MADVKISALPAVASVGLTDVLPIVQAGVTDKATVAQVRAALMPVVLSGADVSGVLPIANQAAQTLAGDATGTTGASVVAKVNGATAPAAGALTTGNVLQVTGISALGYAPVNLAGGANYVTGALPVANQAVAGSSGQFLWNNAGVQAGAAGFTYDLATTQALCAPGCGILFRNVANTFQSRLYWDTTAARTVIFPDTTDTVAVLAFAQTLTNKTIVAASNTITDTSAALGDILRHNGTSFVRLARGAANQVLTTNAGGTDIAWAAPAAGGGALPVNHPAVEKGANYTLVSTTDHLVTFTGAGPWTATLPATPTAGDEYVIANESSANVTVAGNGNAFLVAGSNTIAPGQAVTFVKSTTANWIAS